jgi:signal transduction histidine kinase
MTDNFLESATRRSITLEARHAEALRETLDRVRDDVAELRAALEWLVLAADADRNRIERELHESVQQHLVALAVDRSSGGPRGRCRTGGNEGASRRDCAGRGVRRIRTRI